MGGRSGKVRGGCYKEASDTHRVEARPGRLMVIGLHLSCQRRSNTGPSSKKRERFFSTHAIADWEEVKKRKKIELHDIHISQSPGAWWESWPWESLCTRQPPYNRHATSLTTSISSHLSNSADLLTKLPMITRHIIRGRDEA